MKSVTPDNMCLLGLLHFKVLQGEDMCVGALEHGALRAAGARGVTGEILHFLLTDFIVCDAITSTLSANIYTGFKSC